MKSKIPFNGNKVIHFSNGAYVFFDGVILGRKVELVDTGYSYPNYKLPLILSYIQRYRPCNVHRTNYGIDISSGYNTKDDLKERKDLSWTIACNYVLDAEIEEPKILIRSNENHFLVIKPIGVNLVVIG